jgi:hypothetical protein
VDTILFLTADPTELTHLKLGKEAREIRSKLQQSKHRDFFKFEDRQAVRPEDISQALLDVNPKYVHFSGHGTNTGKLCVEDINGEVHPLSPDALSGLFEVFSNQVECVILNACYSEMQAEVIAKHVKFVIGMNTSIADDASIAFSVGFYQALCANRTIEDSYKLGCVQIQLQNLPGHLTPMLYKNGEIIIPTKLSAHVVSSVTPSDRSHGGTTDVSSSNMRDTQIVISRTLSAKKDFLQELQHVDFIKQNRSRINLEEIFVFPTLSRTKDAFEKEIVDSSFFLDKKENLAIVTGMDSSGKTALLKWLFLTMREGSYSPLLIDANEIVKTKNFDSVIKKIHQNEYSSQFDKWVVSENKIALVDNFHHKVSNHFLEYLISKFSMVVLSIDDDEWVAYLKDDPNFAKFSVVTIGQLSLPKQEELIKNWKKLDFVEPITPVDDLEIDKLELKVNSVITKNRIVPRYPFYILSILQTLETFMPKDYSITAYGHCYQALVTAQILKKGIKSEQIDDSFNFLRELSFDIFGKKSNDEIYTESDYQKFKKYYREKFFIKDFVLNRLENSEYEIIRIGRQVDFTHEYIFYFFVGMYFASVDNPEESLNCLIESIHLKQNALIVIFTVHHTQSKKLLENILTHSICSFDGTKAARLTTDETHFMNELISELPSDIVSKKNVAETRKDIRELQDLEHDKHEKKKQLVIDDNDVSAVEINKGLRIIEVLGQILKNRGGSFEKSVVVETLENTINLGLRILNLLLESLKGPEFREWLIMSLEDTEEKYSLTHNKSLNDEKKIKFVEKSIQLFGYAVTVTMLNRISASISNDKLNEAIILLTKKNDTPAYALISFLARLSQEGIDVTEIKELIFSFDKTKNNWAKKTLSYYIQGYLSTHNIKYQDRQKIFAILGLDYVPNKYLS